MFGLRERRIHPYAGGVRLSYPFSYKIEECIFLRIRIA